MANHETKTCPRCNGPFECKPGNITQCHCYGLTFTEAEKEYIRAHYNDCLCGACLAAMKSEARIGPVKQKMQTILSTVTKNEFRRKD